MSRRKRVVMGVDLAVRATGLVAVPLDWTDWDQIATMTIGYDLLAAASTQDQIDRLVKIREAVLDFAKKHAATHAWFEQYAFSRQQSRAHAAGELGGTLKVALSEKGLRVDSIGESQSRGLLGDDMPRKDRKVWAVKQLRTAGAPRSWTVDEYDAFTAANWGLSEIGGRALIMRST